MIERIKHMWISQPAYTKESLGKITSPTLVIAGDQDAVTPEHTVALFRAIPDAQLCIVPNAEHGVLPEEAVLTFFSASDSGDD